MATTIKLLIPPHPLPKLPQSSPTLPHPSKPSPILPTLPYSHQPSPPSPTLLFPSDWLLIERARQLSEKATNQNTRLEILGNRYGSQEFPARV